MTTESSKINSIPLLVQTMECLLILYSVSNQQVNTQQLTHWSSFLMGTTGLCLNQSPQVPSLLPGYMCLHLDGSRLQQCWSGAKSWSFNHMSRDKNFITYQFSPLKWNHHQQFKYLHVKPAIHWPPPLRHFWLWTRFTCGPFLFAQFIVWSINITTYYSFILIFLFFLSEIILPGSF